MLTEPARILAVSGAAVLLETSRKTACGKCSAKSGCGQYLFGPDREALWLGQELLTAGSLTHLRAGAEVTLGAQGSKVAGLAVVFYLLPLATLMLGTLMTSQLTDNEGWLASGALAGLAAGLAMLPTVLHMPAIRLHCTLMPSDAQVPADSQEFRI